MLIIPALLVMTLFFSLTDLQAGEKGYFDIEVKLNGTLIYFDPQNTKDISQALGFSNVKSLNSGVEMVMNIVFDDGHSYSSRFLIVVDYCSTAYPSLGNVATPGTPDFTNLTFLANYSSSTAGASCKVGNYTGSLYKAIYAVTKGVADSEFSLRLWGGTTFDYVTWFKINGISVFEYTSELELSFQNIKSQQDLENKLNSLNNTQQQTNSKLEDLNKKQDQTNGKLEDLNKNLKSDEIDNNSGFFSNFSSSDHGLAGIITSPLRAINKLTSVCQPVSFNVLDEPIELPCGDTLFWNKEGVQSFKLIWNILVGGPILFLLLKKLFKVVENLKNPDDDRIEVLDL